MLEDHGPDWLQCPCGGEWYRLPDLKPCPTCGETRFTMAFRWFYPRQHASSTATKPHSQCGAQCPKCLPLKRDQVAIGVLDVATGRLELAADWMRRIPRPDPPKERKAEDVAPVGA